MMGSFIGFTIGGAAASMEVEKNMTDAPRSVRAVFFSLSFFNGHQAVRRSS